MFTISFSFAIQSQHINTCLCVNLTSTVPDFILIMKIRTFGENFAHARVKGHDFENGEYLNSK